MKKIILFLSFFVYAYCLEVKVAAAANTAYAMEELIKKFNETNPDIKISLSLASSGKLNAQIKNKAPFDIFMAANIKFAQDLVDHNLTIGDAKVYAKGKLALISVANFDVANGLDELKNPKLKTISIANPTTAPYGTAALEAIKNANLYDAIKDKLIQAGSISEALSQSLKASDAGFIAASALYSDKLKKYISDKKLSYLMVDSSLYTPIDQAMVLLKGSSEDARKFYDFVLNEKEIFEKFGYEK